MPGNSNTTQQAEPSVAKPVRPNTRSTKTARYSNPRTEDPYSKYSNNSSSKARPAADTSHSIKSHGAKMGGAESWVRYEDVDDDDSEDTSESEGDKPPLKHARPMGKSDMATRRVSFGAPTKGHENPSVTVSMVQPVQPSQNDKATAMDAEEEGSQLRTSNHIRPASLHLPGSFATDTTRIDTRRFMDERSSNHENRPPPPEDAPRQSNFEIPDPNDAFSRFLRENREPLNLETPTTHHGLGGYPPDHNPSGFGPRNPQFSPSMASPNPFAPYSPLPPHLQPVHPGHRPPPTGHELLATMLTDGTSGLTPMYRRFEALNHRLLLHLQDEISELEEQLNALDAADTQERAFPGGVYPASRRRDNNSSDIQWRKTNILGNIGYKLATYNRVLSSFKETMEFPTPLVGEVNDYITYLDNQHPIVDLETKFLDCHQDLITFSQYSIPSPRTPIPHSRSHGDHGSNVSTRSTPTSKKNPTTRKAPVSDTALRDVILGMLLAIFVPIVSFGTIPGFVGRMTVVVLVSVGVVLTLVRSGALRTLAQSRSGLDGLVCLGAYGVVMAIIARALG